MMRCAMIRWKMMGEQLSHSTPTYPRFYQPPINAVNHALFKSPELLSMVLGYLNHFDLLRAERTCKHFLTAVRGSSNLRAITFRQPSTPCQRLGPAVVYMGQGREVNIFKPILLHPILDGNGFSSGRWGRIDSGDMIATYPYVVDLAVEPQEDSWSTTQLAQPPCTHAVIMLQWRIKGYTGYVRKAISAPTQEGLTFGSIKDLWRLSTSDMDHLSTEQDPDIRKRSESTRITVDWPACCQWYTEPSNKLLSFGEQLKLTAVEEDWKITLCYKLKIEQPMPAIQPAWFSAGRQPWHLPSMWE